MSTQYALYLVYMYYNTEYMFPTFISFTNKHPRYVAVVGFSIFILGIVLFGFAYLAMHQSEIVVAPAQVAEEQNEGESSFEEKMRVLESLKNTSVNTLSEEEKMKILGGLAPDTESTVSTEEKMKILESLKR